MNRAIFLGDLIYINEALNKQIRIDLFIVSNNYTLNAEISIDDSLNPVTK